MEYVIIRDESGVMNFQRRIKDVTELAVDLEGDALCRSGKINTIQIYSPSENAFFLFDCKSLTAEQIRTSLQTLFQSVVVTKYFFDCRADVDALYHQYKINLNKVIDVQLYEVAFRKCKGLRTGYYNGLYKTLSSYSHDIGVTSNELRIKNKYSEHFKTKNYEMNLDEGDVLNYLSIDVIYLHKLYNMFAYKIGRSRVYGTILEETDRRINIWKGAVFKQGRANAISVI